MRQEIVLPENNPMVWSVVVNSVDRIRPTTKASHVNIMVCLHCPIPRLRPRQRPMELGSMIMFGSVSTEPKLRPICTHFIGISLSIGIGVWQCKWTIRHETSAYVLRLGPRTKMCGLIALAETNTETDTETDSKKIKWLLRIGFRLLGAVLGIGFCLRMNR